jgi:hypothetical protein
MRHMTKSESTRQNTNAIISMILKLRADKSDAAVGTGIHTSLKSNEVIILSRGTW